MSNVKKSEESLKECSKGVNSDTSYYGSAYNQPEATCNKKT